MKVASTVSQRILSKSRALLRGLLQRRGRALEERGVELRLLEHGEHRAHVPLRVPGVGRRGRGGLLLEALERPPCEGPEALAVHRPLRLGRLLEGARRLPEVRLLAL